MTPQPNPAPAGRCCPCGRPAVGKVSGVWTCETCWIISRRGRMARKEPLRRIQENGGGRGALKPARSGSTKRPHAWQTCWIVTQTDLNRLLARARTALAEQPGFVSIEGVLQGDSAEILYVFDSDANALSYQTARQMVSALPELTIVPGSPHILREFRQE